MSAIGDINFKIFFSSALKFQLIPNLYYNLRNLLYRNILFIYKYITALSLLMNEIMRVKVRSQSNF